MKKSDLILIASLFLLQGCALGISEFQPVSPNLPESYSIQETTQSATASRWWTNFNSTELNMLEEKALVSLREENKKKGNFDLQIAWSRLKQSASTLKKSQANFFPSIDYKANENKQISTNQKTKDQDKTSMTSDSYSLGLSASYEIDLWGKVMAQNQAEQFRYQATYEDVLTTVLSVSSLIANTYIDVLATRAEINILEKQVELNSTMLEIQKTRYAHGQSSGLDVLQQQEQLIRTASEKPTLQEKERASLASLAILLGELPNYAIEIKEQTLPSLPPLPSLGIPADLLKNRPDIKANAYRLQAYDKELAIAKLGYFPNLILSASSNFASGALNLLFNNWANSLVMAVSGTLFDAGKKNADKEKARATAEEWAIKYTQIIANALNETETALMAEKAKAQYIANLNEQLIYANAAEEEARIRYLYGKDTFLRYITQLQSVQSLERTLIREQANLLKLRVSLYKSLGTGL